MAVIFQDSFTEATTDTNLDSHVPDAIGTSWVFEINGATTTLQAISATGTLRTTANAASQHLLYSSRPNPASSDYDLQFAIAGQGAATWLCWWLIGRYIDSSNFYGAGTYVGAAAADKKIYKKVSGTVTELASGDTGSLNTGDVIKFEVRDATKKLYKNGVEQLSTTDNVLTAAGRVGIGAGGLFVAGDGVGINMRIDNYKVTEVISAATLTLDTIASSVVILAATLVPGAVALTPGAIASSLVIRTATVVPGAAPVTAPAIAGVSSFYQPMLSLNVTAPLRGSTAAAYAASVAPGAITLTMPAIASQALLLDPTIITIGGTFPPKLASTVAIYEPVLGLSLTTALVTSTAQLSPAELAYLLGLPTTASAASLFGATVLAALEANAISSGMVIHPATATPGLVLTSIGNQIQFHGSSLELGTVILQLPELVADAALWPPAVHAGVLSGIVHRARIYVRLVSSSRRSA